MNTRGIRYFAFGQGKTGFLVFHIGPLRRGLEVDPSSSCHLSITHPIRYEPQPWQAFYALPATKRILTYMNGFKAAQGSITITYRCTRA